MTTVQPMASAMNLTAPAAPTFFNKVRAGNRNSLMMVGVAVAILIAIIMFMRRKSAPAPKKKKKERYSMEDASEAAKRVMKKMMR